MAKYMTMEEIEDCLALIDEKLQDLATQLVNLEQAGIDDSRYADVVVEAQWYMAYKEEMLALWEKTPFAQEQTQSEIIQ